MINMLTASHAASMIDTTDYIMCGNGGQCRSYDYVIQSMCINHMIFRGDNTHIIRSVALYGAFTPLHVCLYTPPILRTV